MKYGQEEDKMIKEDIVITEEEETQKLSDSTAEETDSSSSKAKLISSLLNEDEEKTPELRHWKDVMQAFSINGMWFRRQLPAIGLIVLGIILYITNRYQAQQEMIEEEKLRSELQDKKFRSMTRNSELTFRCRQSQLESQLKAMGDSTLVPSNEPLYKLVNDK